MKKTVLFISIVLLICFTAGCSNSQVSTQTTKKIISRQEAIAVATEYVENKSREYPIIGVDGADVVEENDENYLIDVSCQEDEIVGFVETCMVNKYSGKVVRSLENTSGWEVDEEFRKEFMSEGENTAFEELSSGNFDSGEYNSDYSNQREVAYYTVNAKVTHLPNNSYYFEHICPYCGNATLALTVETKNKEVKCRLSNCIGREIGYSYTIEAIY